MNSVFDTRKLARLILELQHFTGIRTNVLDPQGRDIRLSGTPVRFCELINAIPEGHTRCQRCDELAVENCLTNREMRVYRCHVGLCEISQPVMENGEPIACLNFGQCLDDSDIQSQWKKTRRLLDWYPGDMEELKEAFFSLRQLSESERKSYAELVVALLRSVQHEELLQRNQNSDLVRLERYLNKNYMESLSLKQIAGDLNMGTTKLCSLAKKLSPNKTLTRLISERRVAAAKALLLGTEESVSSVAGKVGFSDYNYFTKIFKSVTGMTPSAYRKKNRK